MRTLIPACLLSQPNSLMVSPALRTTSFFTMYSLYSRLLDALCNHAAPHSNSSYKIINGLTSKINCIFFYLFFTAAPPYSFLGFLFYLPGNHLRHSKKGKLQSVGWHCTHPGACQQTRTPTNTKMSTPYACSVSVT